MSGNALHWFRKGLRLHDNAALLAALRHTTGHVFPVYVLDPWFARPEFVGVLRYNFLLEVRTQWRLFNVTKPHADYQHLWLQPDQHHAMTVFLHPFPLRV